MSLMEILKLMKTVGAIALLMIYYCILHVISVLVDWMGQTTSLNIDCNNEKPLSDKKTGDNVIESKTDNESKSNGEYCVINSKKDD